MCDTQEMSSKLCAYCTVIAEMAPVYAYTQISSLRTQVNQGGWTSATTTKRAHIAARCGNCGALNVAVATGPNTDTGSSPIGSAVNILMDSANSVVWHPTAVSSREFPDVPAHVARCASEAFQAAGIGAYIAAILMARTTIEATAKSQQITKGNLIDKIDAVAAAQLIRPALREAAHAIRHLGNDMAHGDVEESPAKVDADDVLQLMAMILTEVFEAAALTKAIMDRRK